MQSVETRLETVPLEDATRARIRFHHGAGQLIVRSGSDPTLLLTGELGEHAEVTVRRTGDAVDVALVRSPPTGQPGSIRPTGGDHAAI